MATRKKPSLKIIGLDNGVKDVIASLKKDMPDWAWAGMAEETKPERTDKAVVFLGVDPATVIEKLNSLFDCPIYRGQESGLITPEIFDITSVAIPLYHFKSSVHKMPDMVEDIIDKDRAGTAGALAFPWYNRKYIKGIAYVKGNSAEKIEESEVMEDIETIKTIFNLYGISPEYINANLYQDYTRYMYLMRNEGFVSALKKNRENIKQSLRHSGLDITSILFSKYWAEIFVRRKKEYRISTKKLPRSNSLNLGKRLMTITVKMPDRIVNGLGHLMVKLKPETTLTILWGDGNVMYLDNTAEEADGLSMGLPYGGELESNIYKIGIYSSDHEALEKLMYWGRDNISFEVVIDDCPALDTLQIQGLQSIKVKGAPSNLQYLDMSDSRVKEIDLSQLKKLRRLYCNRSKLESLDLSQNPEIAYLGISECPNLKRLKLPAKPRLRVVGLDETPLGPAMRKELHAITTLNGGFVRKYVSGCWENW